MSLGTTAERYCWLPLIGAACEKTTGHGVSCQQSWRGGEAPRVSKARSFLLAPFPGVALTELNEQEKVQGCENGQSLGAAQQEGSIVVL